MPGDSAPEWIDQAAAIHELAVKIGVDADGLEDEIQNGILTVPKVLILVFI